jgi:5-methyltetrahydrofolate--homocysteine methyltransferase
MKNYQELYNILSNTLAQRILFLDGAMGTMLQRYKLNEQDFRGDRFVDYQGNMKGNNDILCLTQPKIIQEIHEKYLEAGADIIETNTFNANAISQDDYSASDLVYEINYEAARIARLACEKFSDDKPRYVAGSMGPTNQTASMSPDVNNPGYRKKYFDDFVAAYKEQARGLIEGGADILLIETITDTLNCKAAIYAINELCHEMNIDIPPLMISGTVIDSSGRTLSGQTTEAFLNSIAHAKNLLSVGLNCSLGPKQMRPFVEEMSKKAPYYLSIYPNAGLPNEFGGYDESPRDMVDVLGEYAEAGFINIVGGCCGTTEQHIAEFQKTLKNAKSRQIPKIDKYLRLSGLEPLTIRQDSNFINIGERTNVAGSRKFARFIREEDYETATQVARQQVENGAQIIDVNMDDAMLDSVESMKAFLNTIAVDPDICRVPVMIDSSKWEVLEAGLKCIQGKGIVNSISMKEGEEIFKKQAETILNYGAAVIIMAFDELGQATSLERKTEICQRAYNILVNEVGFNPRDIIFDMNILTIATGIEEHNNYAVNFIEAARWIKENLPGAYISGGVSNLSFSFRGNNMIREAMHSAFLYHAIKAGMDMGIVNAGQLEVYDEIEPELLELVEDVILNRREDSTERLIEYSERHKGDSNEKEEKIEEWRSMPLEDRLSHALVKGILDYLDEDVNEALAKFDIPLEIIEQPLMNGMARVGELFGSGKMFLPQVVKSARVMKKAVSILLPYLEDSLTSGAGSGKAGKILLATVKGDVHDIGKNIVSVVLSCNNYEVIDLGVMTPSEVILETVKKEKVDIIGLSGLITPSLDEMVHVASELEREGYDIPLLIGGATTSKLHTAVRIDKNYSAPVVHVLDASLSVPVVSKLLKTEAKTDFTSGLNNEYTQLRENHEKRQATKSLISYEKARDNKFSFDAEKANITEPKHLGNQILKDVDLSILREYIDWTQFFITWEMKGKYPRIFDHPKFGEEAKKLFNDANELLDKIIAEKSIQAHGIFGIYKANSIGEDIEVNTGNGENVIFNMLRQQTKKDKANLSLADYIAPKELGIDDYIGFFAVTAGFGVKALANLFRTNDDDYNALMSEILADRLAEAFAEYLHKEVRENHWGYSKDGSDSVEDLLRVKYSGIRPAPGYPSLPDHSEKIKLFDILHVQDNVGIELTESFMMMPAASVSGIYFAHPESRYFPVGRIAEDQVEDYSERNGKSKEKVEKMLQNNLAYK